MTVPAVRGVDGGGDVDGHVAIVYLEGPSFRYECHEPEGANCRLAGGADCQCEDWAILRDERGPFHLTDSDERHDMRDDGECNVVNWLDDTDSPFGGDAELRLRIVPKWDGDGFIVEDFTPLAAVGVPADQEAQK